MDGADCVEGVLDDGELSASDFFGYGVASLGDFDGDGVCDIVVGAQCDDDSCADAGAVYIILLQVT